MGGIKCTIERSGEGLLAGVHGWVALLGCCSWRWVTTCPSRDSLLSPVLPLVRPRAQAKYYPFCASPHLASLQSHGL